MDSSQVSDEWQTGYRWAADEAAENNDYNEKQKTENEKICKTDFELFDNQG
jgi:hypothetical protein